MRRTLYVAAFLLVPTVLLAALTPVGRSSRVDARSAVAQQAAPETPVYDEAADAAVQIETALAVARKENTRVLVQWGGNWCGWCKLLHQMFRDDREISRELLYEYEVVRVDIGRWDKNLDLVERFGADIKGGGVPYLTVLDADGTVVTNQETGALEKKDSETPAHDREKVLGFLKANHATPWSATTRLKEAQAEAGRSGRKVFVHFGAPWCGWCRRLESWLARPRVAMIWSRAFVDLKIDQDRDIDGMDIEKTFTEGKPSGIPFFVIVEPDGKVVADSFIMPDGGNVGCPWSEEELTLFGQFLEKNVPAIGEAERASLIGEMAKQRQEEEAAAAGRG
jgi:thiol:disulfide interchange protein